MLEFFGGVPEIIVPDNLRSGVVRVCRYDPEINLAYKQWADHYGTVIMPARPRKPKDKSKVEGACRLLSGGYWQRLLPRGTQQVCCSRISTAVVSRSLKAPGEASLKESRNPS